MKTNTLPQYWCVIANPTIPGWEKVVSYMQSKGSNFKGIDSGAYYGFDSDGDCCGFASTYYYNSFINNPTLLTIAQFVEMTEGFVLPEKWCVNVYDRNLKITNWFNQHSQTGQHQYESFSIGYFHFPAVRLSNGLCHQSSNIQPGYTEITFEQFKQYVLKQEPVAFDEKEWNIEVTSKEQFDEVIEFLLKPGFTGKKWWLNNTYGYGGGARFIRTNDDTDGFNYDESRSNNYPIEKSITWQQFQTLKNKTMKPNPETPAAIMQTISKTSLKEIFLIACDAWQTKLKDKAREYPFATYVSFTEVEVEEMFKACTSAQLPVLSKFFKRIVEDKNAFISTFDYDITNTISKTLFGDVDIFTILKSGTPADQKELKAKAFYVRNTHEVKIGKTESGGTWISIYKK